MPQICKSLIYRLLEVSTCAEEAQWSRHSLYAFLVALVWRSNILRLQTPPAKKARHFYRLPLRGSALLSFPACLPAGMLSACREINNLNV